MSSGTEQFLAGQEVGVDPIEIERELARLWKPASARSGGEGAVVRACLANLVVFLPEPLEWSTAQQLFNEIASEHPARLIFLQVDPQTPLGKISGGGRSHLRASVSANCSRPRAGVAPVCCEQITLRAHPEEVSLFRGAVAPLLVPDIPVYLWWEGDPLHPVLPQLAGLADRVIVNSRRDGFGSTGLTDLAALAQDRRVRELVDMGWRGLTRWRLRLADMHDDEALRPLLARPERIVLEFATAEDAPASGDGARTSILTEPCLLAGWMISRLGLARQTSCGRRASGLVGKYRRRDGGRTVIKIRAADDGGPRHLLAGEPCAVEFSAAEGSRVRLAAHPHCAQLAEIHSHTSGACQLPVSVPFVRQPARQILLEILNRPPHPRIFREALVAASQLFAATK